MGERNSVYVFKDCSEEQLRDSLVCAVADLAGQLQWDTHPNPMQARMLTSHNDRVHAAYIHDKGHEIASLVGKRLAIPWMNVRIQEGSLWDYSLYLAEEHLDNFSVHPEYWDDDEAWQATQRGKPEVLAKVWKVDQSRIENYVKPWGRVVVDEGTYERTRRGKAYPGDEFGYGEIWQMNDFLRALGAHDPNYDQPHCVSRLLTFARKKKPFWRFW